jgi:hypothetical protein
MCCVLYPKPGAPLCVSWSHLQSHPRCLYFADSSVPAQQHQGEPDNPNETHEAAGSTGRGKKALRSSWDAKDARGGSAPDADYLYELGRSDINLNIDTGQNSIMLDSLFTGAQAATTLWHGIVVLLCSNPCSVATWHGIFLCFLMSFSTPLYREVLGPPERHC